MGVRTVNMSSEKQHSRLAILGGERTVEVASEGCHDCGGVEV